MVSRSTWPVTQHEPRSWTSSIDVPRRWRATYAGPYQSAVEPSIAGAVLDLPATVAALVSEASVALAAFDAEMGANIAPFAAILLRSESASSSRIERLTASAKAIALAELGFHGRRNATEIAANTAAMRAAIDLADRVDAEAIIATHAALLEKTDPEATGAWRSEAVWIGSSNYGPHTAQFVPPHHERLDRAIADLVAFMRRDDLPALAQAALAHAQFETIHPFTDGNGRTGRALIHSLLRSKGITRHVAVPVSAGLLVDVERYFEALTAYRSGDPFPIIERLAEAAYAAVSNGRALVDTLRQIRNRWAAALDARPQAVAWRLLDVVLRQPVLDVAFVRRELGVQAQAAGNAIERLVEVGALRQFSTGRRNRKFEAREVLAALDAFAERGGLRTRG